MQKTTREEGRRQGRGKRIECGGKARGLRGECGGKAWGKHGESVPKAWGKPGATLAALTLWGGLRNMAQVGSGYEFGAEPTCAGAEPPLAGGQCVHRPPGTDTAVSGPRTGCARPAGWVVPDLRFRPVAPSFPAGTAPGIGAHGVVPHPGAAGDPAAGL